MSGPGNHPEPDFDLDFGRGKQGELYVSNAIESLQRALVEVKTDDRAAETGRLYVEYQCRGEPSGIATTKTDFWAFVVSRRVILFVLTDDLRKFAKRAYATKRNRVEQPRGKYTSKGIAVPFAEIIKWAAELEPLPEQVPGQLRLADDLDEDA